MSLVALEAHPTAYTHIESSCLELKHLAVPHSSHLAHLAINHVVKPLTALEGSAGGDSG